MFSIIPVVPKGLFTTGPHCAGHCTHLKLDGVMDKEKKQGSCTRQKLMQRRRVSPVVRFHGEQCSFCSLSCFKLLKSIFLVFTFLHQFLKSTKTNESKVFSYSVISQLLHGTLSLCRFLAKHAHFCLYLMHFKGYAFSMWKFLVEQQMFYEQQLCGCATVVAVAITISLHCPVCLFYHLDKQPDVVVGLAAKRQ